MISQGGLLLPAKNAEMQSMDLRKKIQSPANSGGMDDLEKTQMHYQTMHVSWQQEPVMPLDNNEDDQSIV